MKGIGDAVVEKGTAGFTLGNGPEYMGSRGSSTVISTSPTVAFPKRTF